ncbi:hypothetical protein HMPREF0454_02794 [Hafnia alvei ATCC 51873]|uniref:Uncharacterized protein n=1 Tax=Hafnia alvei ATCC 51873 TaxID=1002364 RepID=G9Y883_HAFAL|nr:hypothetical protein HMPREF0454_02794 [Hafnia alvei ATCC 51873]
MNVSTHTSIIRAKKKNEQLIDIIQLVSLGVLLRRRKKCDDETRNDDASTFMSKKMSRAKKANFRPSHKR